MSGIASDRVAVIVASIDARATVVASLARFREEVAGRGEVVLVDASRDGTAEMAAQHFPDLHVIRCDYGRLAPELWAEGLRATDAPLVAFSTAAMAPRPGWLGSLVDRLESTGAAAVGGPIEPVRLLSATDRAVYLLRYVRYLRPLPESGMPEPPGDNALYRRDRLMSLVDPLSPSRVQDAPSGLWHRGFWEVEVHRALRDRGERIVMAPEAVVEFLGGSHLPSTLRQRLAHARHYGSSRARGRGLGYRVVRSVASPAVPAVLLGRIAGALRGRSRPFLPWMPALPSLALLLLSWSIGEAAGVWTDASPS
jgi:hypothetical protein